MKWIADVTPLRGEKIASLWFPTARKRLHRFLLGENERERLETADQRIFGRRDAVSLNAEFESGRRIRFQNNDRPARENKPHAKSPLIAVGPPPPRKPIFKLAFKKELFLANFIWLLLSEGVVVSWPSSGAQLGLTGTISFGS